MSAMVEGRGDSRRRDDNARRFGSGNGGLKAGEVVEVKIGKPDADIAKGASGTVSVWDGEPGSETDTGEDETALAKARAVTSGKFATLTRLAGKTGWYVDCWEA